jgi:hypothetical protein
VSAPTDRAVAATAKTARRAADPLRMNVIGFLYFVVVDVVRMLLRRPAGGLLRWGVRGITA